MAEFKFGDRVLVKKVSNNEHSGIVVRVNISMLYVVFPSDMAQWFGEDKVRLDPDYQQKRYFDQPYVEHIPDNAESKLGTQTGHDGPHIHELHSIIKEQVGAIQVQEVSGSTIIDFENRIVSFPFVVRSMNHVLDVIRAAQAFIEYDSIDERPEAEESEYTIIPPESEYDSLRPECFQEKREPFELKQSIYMCSKCDVEGSLSKVTEHYSQAHGGGGKVSAFTVKQFKKINS